ncbi:MAG TPA: hypothetical protein VHB18_05260 [Mycobacteriales bacterium]|nr:hypothetical protein [Mycobacteriales bacterium]
MSELRAEVGRLRDDIDYLIAVGGLDSPNQSTDVSPRVASRKSAARAHVWHALTAQEAADAWDTLITWVDWLIPRYSLDDAVPACWYRHAALVDELDGLRAAWTDSYLAPNAQPSDACHWLAQLASSIARMHAWDRYGCAAGTHRDDDPAPLSAATYDERLMFVQADIVVRVTNPSGATKDRCRRCADEDRGRLVT